MFYSEQNKSVLYSAQRKSMHELFLISKSETLVKIVAFFVLQLSFWHNGIADFISFGLLQWWNILQMGATLLVVIMFVLMKRVPSGVTVLLIAVKLLTTFSAIMNGVIIDVTELSRYIAIVLIIDYYSIYLDQLIRPLMFIFEFMVYYNCYTLLNAERHIYGGFFAALGYDNDFTRYMLVAYFVAILYNQITGHRIRSFCLIIVVHITLIYPMVGSAVIALFVIDCIILIAYWRLGYFRFAHSLIVYLVLQVSIVFLRIQNLFEFIIVGMLGKDLTLTGRTDVWDYSIDKIVDHIFIGHGDMSQLFEKLILNDVYCHNTFLEVLFRGGIVSLLLWIVIVVVINRKTKNLLDRKTATYCSAIFMGLWIVALTESLLQFGVTVSLFALVNAACEYAKYKTAIAMECEEWE